MCKVPLKAEFRFLADSSGGYPPNNSDEELGHSVLMKMERTDRQLHLHQMKKNKEEKSQTIIHKAM